MACLILGASPAGTFQPSLLPQCDPGRSLKALFDALWAGPRYLLLFGGACPSVASVIARALPAFHLVQVPVSSTRLSRAR